MKVSLKSNSTLSDEQMEQRRGRVCASSIYKIMGKKGFGKTGESYLWELVAERETGINKPIPTSEAMQWGIDHEQEAIDLFSKVTGHEVIGGSTITRGDFASTPDFINTQKAYGGEVKCPFASYKHAQRLRFESYKDVKSNLPEYYWQIVSGMVDTGFDLWKFISYDPRFLDPDKRIVIIDIPSIDDDINLMLERRYQATEFFKNNNANVIM
jgi:exodeoxyribonuclease (lambda-induced)